MMLQQDQPDDYVIATGETHSVRELVEIAFGHVNLRLAGLREDRRPALLRPAEVDHLDRRSEQSAAGAAVGAERAISTASFA